MRWRHDLVQSFDNCTFFSPQDANLDTFTEVNELGTWTASVTITRNGKREILMKAEKRTLDDACTELHRISAVAASIHRKTYGPDLVSAVNDLGVHCLSDDETIAPDAEKESSRSGSQSCSCSQSRPTARSSSHETRGIRPLPLHPARKSQDFVERDQGKTE